MSLFGLGCTGMSLGLGTGTGRGIILACGHWGVRSTDPWREMLPLDALICTQNIRPALTSYRPHQGQPGISCISCGCKVQIDILRVQRIPQQRHIILPTYGGSKRELDTCDGGRYCFQSRGGALSPDQALGACL